MQFFDLNLRNPQLEKQALALGFAKTFTPPTIEIKTQRDLNSLNAILNGSNDLNAENAMSAFRENGENDENKFVFLAVESTNSELLRKAAKRARGRALVNAFLVPKFFQDDGLIRVVVETENVFEIPLHYFLHSTHVHRAKLFDETKAFLKKCLKFKAPFTFSSRAESEFDLKSPREAIAVAQCLSLTREQAAFALCETPARFLKKLSEKFGLESS